MRLEHIGIAVRDIAGARETFSRLLGKSTYKIERVESEHVTTHFLWADGVKIELLEATNSDSVIQKFLDKRGEGLHHLAFNVDNLGETSKALADAGFEVLGSGKKDGADGKSIFFIHPRDTNGVLIECCERSAAGPVPIEQETSNGLDIARFGSDQNPTVIAIFDDVSLRKQPFYAQIVDRLEPTHHVVRIMLANSDVREIQKNPDTTVITPVSRLLSRVTLSPFCFLTIGPDAIHTAPAINLSAGRVEQWIHVAPPDGMLKIEAMPESVMHMIVSDTYDVHQKVSNSSSFYVLPSVAMRPDRPETDALTPLIKSLLPS